MTKSHIAAGAVLAAAVFGASAQAADLPSRKGPPVAPPPAFTWTGFYIGENSGFGGGVFDANVGLAGPAGFLATGTTNRASGSLFGGQIGYNYEFPNNVVIGIETDMQWADIKASHQATTNASTGLAGYTYADIHQGLNWFGTTRGRLGYSFGRVLPYVTGGVAYGEVNGSGLQALGAGAVIAGSNTDTRVGWAVGGGAEIALTSRLSARAEYLYLDLPGVNGPAAAFTVVGPLAGNFSTGNFASHIFRAGANLRFGSVGEVASFATPSNLLGLIFAPASRKWQGFYAGVNGGRGGGELDSVVSLAAPGFLSSTSTTNKLGGFLAGGQIGYNHHYSNNLVAGLETDFQWSDIGASHQATTIPGPVATNIGAHLNWLGTTRARFGWASGSVLTFISGGVAYGEIAVNGSQFTGGALFGGSASQVNVGWTAGGGAEYAITDHLALKVEYLFVDLGNVKGNAFGAPGAFVGRFDSGAFQTHITRFGLNWQLGGSGSAPVLAKY